METAKESVVEKYQEDAGKRQLTGFWFMVARTAAVAMAIFTSIPPSLGR